MKKFVSLLIAILSVTACGREFPQLNEPNIDFTPDYPATVFLAASAVDDNKIMVEFSTNVLENSAETIANYDIIDANLSLLYAEIDRGDNSVVYLYTSNMSANSNYNLTVADVSDIFSNNVMSETNSFSGYGADDATAPEITITEPVEDQLLGKTFHFYGTASDDSGIDYVEIRVNNDPYVRADGTVNWSFDLDTLGYNQNYQHVIYAKAVDLKGNSRVSFVIVSIDWTDPEFTLDTAPSGLYNTAGNGFDITFAGTASDQNNISYISIAMTNQWTNRIYSSVWSSETDWEFVYTIPDDRMEESTNTFVITAIDSAGNVTNDTRSVVVYRDILYCRADGSNNGDGTWWYPFCNINSCGSDNHITNIFLASTNYEFQIGAFNKPYAKIFGGYDDEFNERDYFNNISLIYNVPGRPFYSQATLFDGVFLVGVCGSSYAAYDILTEGTYNITVNNCIASNCQGYFPVDDTSGGKTLNLYISNSTFINSSFSFIQDGLGNGYTLKGECFNNTFTGGANSLNEDTTFYVDFDYGTVIFDYDFISNTFEGYSNAMEFSAYGAGGYREIKIRYNLFNNNRWHIVENSAYGDPYEIIGNSFSNTINALYYNFQSSQNIVTLSALEALDSRYHDNVSD